MNRLSLLICFVAAMVYPLGAEDYSTGLREVPDKLQESFAQAQPAGLVTEAGKAPGDGSGAEALPARVDLSRYLPPVKSQGRIGSCAAWSTIYYARTLLENQERGWGADEAHEIFAPLFTYNQITGGRNIGTYMGDHFEIAVNSGAATWKTFPDNHDPSLVPGRRALNEAAAFKAESWKSLSRYDRATGQWINDPEDVKILLAQGIPVVAGFATYENLYRYRGGIYREASGAFLGGHAMCIVGYDDSRRVFKIVNSWGTDWGEEGFLWLSYDIWPELATRGCVVLYDKVENQPGSRELSPPSSLSATKGTAAESITLRWNHVPGTAEYILYRADNDSGEMTELARTDENSYRDGELPPGVHYLYAVKAGDGAGGMSEFSPISEGWTLQPEPEPEQQKEPEPEPEPQREPGLPGIPGGLASHTEARQLILTWDRVENADGYNIYKWSDRREEWLKYAVSRDNTLVVRDVYSLYREGGGYFIAAAYNGYGEGYASDSLYVNYRSQSRSTSRWRRLAQSGGGDDRLAPGDAGAVFRGRFYRTDYFDYEYTMQQFRDFYEAEQRAFREYRRQEEEALEEWQRSEEEAFEKWKSQY